jgi:outer membrane immunogenic protein
MGKLGIGTAVALASLLGIVSAQAADIAARPAYKAPPPIAPPPFSWTGFYIGANIGAAWANADVVNAFGDSFDVTSDARFIGGGQIGYNWQIGPNWVIGIEATGDGIAGNDRRSRDIIVGGATFNAAAHANWLATVAGRLGYAVDNWLLYAKGGGGWVGFDGRVDCIAGPCAGTFVSNSASRGGWLAGAGVEWAFDRNWSAKVEYNFIGLEERDVGTIDGVLHRIHNPNVQTVTVGVNYLFH